MIIFFGLPFEELLTAPVMDRVVFNESTETGNYLEKGYGRQPITSDVDAP